MIALHRAVTLVQVQYAAIGGTRDGRITLWLDGALIADFGNLLLRDDPTVKIDRYSVMFHARGNLGAATTKYVDNVVAATAYIGPMAP